MAYTTIDDPSAYFQTKIYTGNGSSNHAITFDGNSNMQPDWIWNKSRSIADSHALFDSSRGINKILFSNVTNAEATDGNGNLESFDSNGITVGGNQEYANKSGSSQVTWAWKANGGTTSSNTDGSITSTVQANTTAGFSIVTYTGNNTGGATIGHGLGVAPKVVFTKTRAIADNWLVYHEAIGATKYLTLNTASAEATSSGAWNNTAPSSTVVTLGSFDNSNDNDIMVAYCFAEKQGYSSFGSYTGNGNADGPFIYTGFKPAWFMLKATNDSGRNWIIHNSKMAPTNVAENELIANLTDAEVDNGRLDILSNGIKLRSTSLASNKVNISYIYMAFAEHPFVSSEGVPCTAR